MSTYWNAPAIASHTILPDPKRQPLVMVTAYDAPGARMAHEAAVDMILVGDTLAMVVLDFDDTLPVTTRDIEHHTRAVVRGLEGSDCDNPRPLVVADLPWMSYHTDPYETVRHAATLVRAGGQAVKLEGGRKRLPMIDAVLNAEIPVMGHLGLTPQSTHAFGGFKVQAKDRDAVSELVVDAEALANAGCFAIVLEGVPAAVADLVTQSVEVPTIGIGAGAGCDGQVLVHHDVLGIEDRISPKFVRRYADVKSASIKGLAAYAADTRSGRLPSTADA